MKTHEQFFLRKFLGSIAWNLFESEENLEVNDGSNTGAKKTLYLHLIGVQEIDKATNDFLYDSQGEKVEYHFSLTVHSEPGTDDPTVE